MTLPIAKNLQDKWKADDVMIKAIDRLPGKKTMTEKVVKKSCKPRENSNCNLRVFFYFNKQRVYTQCLCLVLTFSKM